MYLVSPLSSLVHIHICVHFSLQFRISSCSLSLSLTISPPPSLLLCGQFFVHIDVWSEMCSSGLLPSGTAQSREMLSQHSALKERYQQMYNTTRTEGHRLIEKLKRPVGDSRCVYVYVCVCGGGGGANVKFLLPTHPYSCPCV